MNENLLKNQIANTAPVDFKVDSSACLKCGLCVRDCAFNALSSSKSGVPEMHNLQRCMRCQHCFAVCPVGAITFDGVRASDVLEIEGIELPNALQVSNWLKSRRSIRRFSAEDVEPEVLDKILKLLGNTPTGCNARALTFTCYPNRAAMNEFKSSFLKAIEEHREGSKMLPRWLAIPAIRLRNGGEDIFFRGASGLLIVSSDETLPQVTTPQEDVTIACSNFELLANANGIGTCWCGFLRLVQKEVPELLEKILGLPRTASFYAILFGRSAVKYKRSVERAGYANIVYKR
jgi:ferredoxin